MLEFAVGMATIASAVAAVVTLFLALIDRHRKSPQKTEETK
jgi:hypothetical protein